MPDIPRRTRRPCRVAAFCAVILFLTGSLPAVEFPQNPQQWINSGPWSVKQTVGKSVIVVFFNEQDQETLMRWKQLQELSKKYEERPLLFIAVNSGAPRELVQNYVQQVNLTWPVLVDLDKSFAKKFPITEVSPNNGIQVAVINPDGALTPGSWEVPEETVNDALKFAKWNVDPTSVPAALRSAWLMVEFQNYAAAAKDIKKSLKSSKDDVKQGGEALMEYISPLIQAKITAAETAYDAEDKWVAYRNYSEVSEQFKGYDLPNNVEARKKELQNAPDVKVQRDALKTFDAQKKLLSNPAKKKTAMANLRKLVREKPDTDAAKQAEELLQELES